MSQLVSDSIFWIEVDKIKPNPYQPRREFDKDALEALSESIRQYGVLQPLVVTRREVAKEDGGIVVEYELIAGERRLRASKLAGVSQVPVVIRKGEDDNLMKLELAIIENLQREDLNPVDRARAFQQFIDEFGYKHIEIAKKIGKSREYVSNSLRLLSLPDDILDALIAGKITEGHARPLMMLRDKPDEQTTLFKEIIFKKLTVRDAESIARRSAKDKVRKWTRDFDPEILRMEKDLTEQLGTRVHIEPREVGGKITIDFFSDEDLKNLLAIMNNPENRGRLESSFMEKDASQEKTKEDAVSDASSVIPQNDGMEKKIDESAVSAQPKPLDAMIDHKYRTAAVGTVAFGGLASVANTAKKDEGERNPGLGDILRSVLSKDDPESGEHTAQNEEKKEPPIELTMSVDEMLGSTEENEKEPEHTEDGGLMFTLPDMGGFRDEVNSVLGGADIDIPSNDEPGSWDTLRESVTDILDTVKSEEKDDEKKPSDKDDDEDPSGDMYSVRKFAY